MPLPFELRAVEMALKDSKGRNIAEKIDELTTDVDSVVGFDGELEIIAIQGPSVKYQLSQETIDYIKSTTTARIVRYNHSYAYIIFAGSRYFIYNVNIGSTGLNLHQFEVPLDIEPNTDLVHSAVDYVGTKLYMHVVDTTASTVAFITNFANPITAIENRGETGFVIPSGASAKFVLSRYGDTYFTLTSGLIVPHSLTESSVSLGGLRQDTVTPL